MNGDTLEILALPNRYILSIDAHDDAQVADNFHGDVDAVVLGGVPPCTPERARVTGQVIQVNGGLL